MKRIVSGILVCLISVPAIAAIPAGQSRRSMSSQMVMAAPRATASTNQLSAMASISASNPTADTTNQKSSVRVENVEASVPKVDMREKEKAACINNNIGIGNTFVWASRYSNVNNYASMVEDVENPENNTCFVRVELKSNDAKISVSDVPSQYFEMGRNITCGAWADAAKLKSRILDAKKSARTWATVGGAVGGAGVGVGVMELFGNKLIGGKVEGQRALGDNELLRSQLLALKNDKKTSSEYKEFVRQLKNLKRECEQDIWNNSQKPDECNELDYDGLLGVLE